MAFIPTEFRTTWTRSSIRRNERSRLTTPQDAGKGLSKPDRSKKSSMREKPLKHPEKWVAIKETRNLAYRSMEAQSPGKHLKRCQWSRMMKMHGISYLVQTWIRKSLLMLIKLCGKSPSEEDITEMQFKICRLYHTPTKNTMRLSKSTTS